jgi:hypothetical protein
MCAAPAYTHLFSSQQRSLAGDYSVLPGDGTLIVVVRDMDFGAPPGGPVFLQGFRVADFTTDATIWDMTQGAARNGRSYHWRGRAACQGNNGIQIHVLDDQWSWQITGWLLRP